MPPNVQRGAAWAWSLATVVTVVLAPRPTVDNSVTALLRADSPRVAAYQRFMAQFGSDEVVVARISGGTPLERLRLTETMTATLAADATMQGVLSVTALHPEVTTVILDEVFGGPDALAAREPALRSPVVEALGLWSASASRLYGLAMVSPPEDRARLAARLEALRRAAAEDGLDVAYTGPPFLNLALDRAGRRTEAVALPLLLAVVVALLSMISASVRSTVALVAPVGLTVLAVDGTYGALGGLTNILVNIAKPLLFVIGLASAVHVYFEARHLVARGVDPRIAPWAAAQRKALTVITALLTTAVGFGSLGLSAVAPIRAFGRVSGAGLLAMIPAILLGVPLVLSLLGRPRASSDGTSTWSERAEGAITRGAERVVAASLVRPAFGPLLALIVVVAGGACFFLVETEPHAIKYFEPDHPLRRDQAQLEAAGMGVATVEAIVETEGMARDPSAVATLRAFADEGLDDPSVVAAVGWPHLVAEVVAATGREQADGWVLDQLRERPASRAFWREDRVRIAFLVKTVDADAIDRLRAQLHAVADDRFPSDWTLEITGNYALLLHAQDALLETILTSLLWTALLMEIVLILVLRSLRLGLGALLPNLFPVGLNLIAMAALGIPLDLGTSMTAAIALGIAVDDTLHLIMAARRAPLTDAARSAGAAILLSSVVIGLGFVALTGTGFAPTRRFGGLCALAMLSALVADLFVLPPLLQWARREAPLH